MCLRVLQCVQCIGFAFALFRVLQFCSKCVVKQFQNMFNQFCKLCKAGLCAEQKNGKCGNLSYPLLTITSFTYLYFFYLQLLLLLTISLFCPFQVWEERGKSILLITTFTYITSFANCAKLCRVELQQERGSLSYPLLPAGITPENYFRQAQSGNQLILIPTHKVIHIS